MKFLQLQTAHRHVLNCEDIMPLFICNRDLLVCRWFGIGESLTVDILLRTWFSNGCIHQIFHTDCVIIPWHSMGFAIISVNMVHNSVNDTNTVLKVR